MRLTHQKIGIKKVHDTVPLTSLHAVWIRSNSKLVIPGLYLMVYVKCVHPSNSWEYTWFPGITPGGLGISDDQPFLLWAVVYTHDWQRWQWIRKNCCFLPLCRTVAPAQPCSTKPRKLAVVLTLHKSPGPLCPTTFSIPPCITSFVLLLETGKWKSKRNENKKKTRAYQQFIYRETYHQ